MIELKVEVLKTKTRIESKYLIEETQLIKFNDKIQNGNQLPTNHTEYILQKFYELNLKFMAI